MATLTTGNLATGVKEFYDRVLLDRALASLVHTQFGQKRPIPVGGGRSIEFRRYNSIGATTAELTEGTVPSEATITISTVTATVAQYGQYLKVSDLLEVANFDPIMAEQSEILGEDAGDMLDRVCRDVLVAGTNIRFASTTATTPVSRMGVASGFTLNATEIRKAVRTLEAANAKPVAGRDFIALIHANTKYDVMSDSTIVNHMQYAGVRGEDNPLFVGEIGSWMGVRFVESTNAKIWASMAQSGADAYATLFIGANAYGVADVGDMGLETYYKPRGSAGTADPLDQIATQGWKSNFAAVILNQNFIVRVEHQVTP